MSEAEQILEKLDEVREEMSAQIKMLYNELNEIKHRGRSNIEKDIMTVLKDRGEVDINTLMRITGKSRTYVLQKMKALANKNKNIKIRVGSREHQTPTVIKFIGEDLTKFISAIKKTLNNGRSVLHLTQVCNMFSIDLDKAHVICHELAKDKKYNYELAMDGESIDPFKSIIKKAR
jgi:hypothetical protein